MPTLPANQALPLAAIANVSAPPTLALGQRCCGEQPVEFRSPECHFGRFFGSAAACTSGGFDDHDDLIFSTARGFTDNPIVPGVTFIKGVHITELRDRIDAVRRTRGLGAFPYTNPGPAAGTLISAVDVTELRAALTQAYIAAG